MIAPPVKPALLLIPGTLCDQRMFVRQIKVLGPHSSVHCASFESLRDMSSWIDALLLRMPPRFSVAGFSLGGLLALELLRRAPERIERLAMIGSNAQAGNDRSRRRSAWLQKLWRARGAAVVAKQVKPDYFHHEAKRRAHQRLVMQMAVQTTKRAAFAQFTWAAERPQGFDAMRSFTGPLLAVSGTQDRLCPLDWQQAMQAAQPCLVRGELPRCGHFVPLESPAKLNSALIHWLNMPVVQSLKAQKAII